MATSDKQVMASTLEKQAAIALLKSIETGESGPRSAINPQKYIQHNLMIEDGLAGFEALLQQLPPHFVRVNTVRVFQDGAYVFAHTDYDFFGPKVGFDIYRFENGLLVEHWDNLQETPSHPNPSGHTMIDGSTTLADLEQTKNNKELVRTFIEDILVNGNMGKLAEYFDGDHYIQHNPQIADGLSGLGQALQAWAQQGIILKYDQIHLVLGEGNFVLVVSEGTMGKTPLSIYDMFRVERGKIVEHWDTVETIPPSQEWKNSNGKF